MIEQIKTGIPSLLITKMIESHNSITLLSLILTLREDKIKFTANIPSD